MRLLSNLVAVRQNIASLLSLGPYHDSQLASYSHGSDIYLCPDQHALGSGYRPRLRRRQCSEAVPTGLLDPGELVYAGQQSITCPQRRSRHAEEEIEIHARMALQPYSLHDSWFHSHGPRHRGAVEFQEVEG